MSRRYGALPTTNGYPARMSYLIDPFGGIYRIYTDVDPATHPQKVLNELTALDPLATNPILAPS